MNKNTRNIILFSTGLIFLTGALIGFNMYNKGPMDVSEGKALVTNPVSLYTAYITDSLSAQNNFDGKIVKLTGEVSGLTENTQKQQVVLIKTSAAGGNINCTMDKALPGLSVGSIVTLKGICSGIGQGDADLGIAGDVYLTRTIIIN